MNADERRKTKDERRKPLPLPRGGRGSVSTLNLQSSISQNVTQVDNRKSFTCTSLTYLCHFPRPRPPRCPRPRSPSHLTSRRARLAWGSSEQSSTTPLPLLVAAPAKAACSQSVAAAAPRSPGTHMYARHGCAHLVHPAHVLRQAARIAERSGAVEARVVPALLVHRAHVRRQVACLAERSGAVGTSVVTALLVHRAHVRL